MDIRVELSVVVDNLRCRDLVSINEEIKTILEDTCNKTHVLLEEFTISSHDEGTKCVFIFVLSSDEVECLNDTALSDKLCSFVDDMCSIHKLKPKEFSWRRI